MEHNISAVIIDTSIYCKEQSDFAGISNSIIPWFMKLIKSYNVKLLSHPILEFEILKHIKESGLIKKSNDLVSSIKRCKDQLEIIGVDPEDWLNKAAVMDTENRLVESFKSFYKDALKLSFVDASEVFDDYFHAKPPFAETGKKKAEFPDAFIIKSVLQYCHHNPSEYVLVVSGDSDWQSSFCGKQNIICVDSLRESITLLMKQFDDKSPYINNVINENLDTIRTAIEGIAKIEAYSIDSIDPLDDVDITRVNVTSIAEDLTILKVAGDEALFQLDVVLSVDGNVDYIDQERSQWDHEDMCYSYIQYTHLDFMNATAKVVCEANIGIPPADDSFLININSIRIIRKNDIDLDITSAKCVYRDIYFDEDDYKAEIADALENNHSHKRHT